MQITFPLTMYTIFGGPEDPRPYMWEQVISAANDNTNPPTRPRMSIDEYLRRQDERIRSQTARMFSLPAVAPKVIIEDLTPEEPKKGFFKIQQKFTAVKTWFKTKVTRFGRKEEVEKTTVEVKTEASSTTVTKTIDKALMSRIVHASQPVMKKSSLLERRLNRQRALAPIKS